MRDRAGQRRHRLTAAGVGGERQVPSAVQLGPLPCAALVQEADNQKRLDGQRASRDEHRAPVFLPQARTAITHDAPRRQPALRDAPPLQLAPVEDRLTWQLWRHSHASRRRAVQDSTGRVGCGATEVFDGQQRPADSSLAEHHGCASQTGEHSRPPEGRRALARPHTPALRVGAQGQVQDRRTAWQVRTAPHDFLKGQIVGPDERQPAVKARELVLELSTPEAAQRSRARSP